MQSTISAPSRSTTPRSRTIAYWASTGLIALAFAAGGAFDLSRAPDVLAAMAHLGYPAYFAGILGAWKLLAVPALLAPRLPRLKEWAYAGIAFDLTGAALSHGLSGDAADKVVTPLVLLALAAVSWALRPADRKLVAAETARPSLAPRPLTADAAA